MPDRAVQGEAHIHCCSIAECAESHKQQLNCKQNRTNDAKISSCSTCQVVIEKSLQKTCVSRCFGYGC